LKPRPGDHKSDTLYHMTTSASENRLCVTVERLDALETIIEWTFEGLDLDKAMSQPATPYKVRHLKMGVRVAGALSACDSYIAFRMLVCTCLYSSIHPQFYSLLVSGVFSVTAYAGVAVRNS